MTLLLLSTFYAFFTEKRGEHLRLQTSYPVPIATDCHQTCVKMCVRDMHTASENGR